MISRLVANAPGSDPHGQRDLGMVALPPGALKHQKALSLCFTNFHIEYVSIVKVKEDT